ncbi:MAG TPA: DUF3368 domain-containing protein [Thermoanaerobaculia bacterium]|nr:DUF3368 domain-containing protein [Thermoanaerobaculia bacterium]
MIVVSNTSPLTSLAAIGRLGAIPEVRPLLDALREQAGFFLGERLYRQVLERAGENTVP